MNEIVSLDKLLQIKCLSDESFEYVTNAIDSSDEDIREQAFTKLMMFSSNYDLLNLIKKGVEDESPLICSDCLEYLYELDSVEAERVIINKLFDPNKVISCTGLELIVRYPLREQTLNLLVKNVDESPR